jgi:cellobiose phosphorylase
VYEIEVRNPRHVSRGVTSLTVDGERVEGNLVPPAEPGRTVRVEVELAG